MSAIPCQPAAILTGHNPHSASPRLASTSVPGAPTLTTAPPKAGLANAPCAIARAATRHARADHCAVSVSGASRSTRIQPAVHWASVRIVTAALSSCTSASRSVTTSNNTPAVCRPAVRTAVCTTPDNIPARCNTCHTLRSGCDRQNGQLDDLDRELGGCDAWNCPNDGGEPRGCANGGAIDGMGMTCRDVLKHLGDAVNTSLAGGHGGVGGQKTDESAMAGDESGGAKPARDVRGGGVTPGMFAVAARSHGQGSGGGIVSWNDDGVAGVTGASGVVGDSGSENDEGVTQVEGSCGRGAEVGPQYGQ